MHIQVHSPRKPARALGAFVERRVRLAVRYHADLVPAVTVRLEDINGPRGGPDKQCRIEMRTAGSGTAVAQAVATTWRSALSAALARAANVLWRLFHRRQDRVRTALPAPGAR